MIRMLILLAISPLLIFVIHVVASRMIKGRLVQIVVVISAMIGEILMALLLWYFVVRYIIGSTADMATVFFYCFVSYNAVACTYFHLFNMSETARRIRMLYEIDKKGASSASELASMYGTTDILDIRLERLIATKQLRYRDGNYILNKKLFYYVALLVAAWRNILGFPKLIPGNIKQR